MMNLSVKQKQCRICELKRLTDIAFEDVLTLAFYVIGFTWFFTGLYCCKYLLD